MEMLDKYFDHYVINARLKPAFFIVMPLAITTLAWCPKAQQLAGVVLTFLITFGVMAFLSNLVSNMGNHLQDRLYDTWGGAPTTIILRHSDNSLDTFTKKRYFNWLGSKIPDLVMPSQEYESSNPVNSDSVYSSITNFLREYTRDKTKYPMIYSDNIAYGFSRNLLAMRSIGIGVALVSIFLNIVFLYVYFISKGLSFLNLIENNISMVLLGCGVIIASTIQLLVFVFTVNRMYVHGRAIRYAKSLLAACEECT